MLEFGNTLRQSREAKGYTISQLAEITHILPQIIENLEREDFSRIVAPIYGRGFVKLYCEAVGLEPKPMIDEFMDIFSGNRPPVIRMKSVDSTPQAAVPSECTPPPMTANPLAEPTDDRPEEPPATTPPKRDYRPAGYYVPNVPRRFWRLAILAGGAAIVIALVVLAGRAIYRASMNPEDGTAPKAEKSAQNAIPRKPAPVPPLYID